MSSPATAAFLTAWRTYVAGRVTLVKIDLTVPSSLTLRYATRETGTPDGSAWQVGVECDPIRESIELLGAGVTPSDASVRITKVPISSSLGTIHSVLSKYLFQNAVVTIYLWVNGAGLSASDMFQVFKGFVSKTVDMSSSGVTLNLIQDMSWNLQMPPTIVDKSTYPNAPDSSQGVVIPIVYGKHNAIPMKSPWTSSYGSKSKQEDSGAGLGVIPGIMVDPGVGGAKAKVLFAGHNMNKLLDRSTGDSVFILGGDILDPIDTAGAASHFSASESYIDVNDESLFAYAGIIPIDVRAAAGGNTSTDPRKAISPFDEKDFATLNQTTGKNELQLILPNNSPKGRIESVQVYVAFTGNAANTQNIRVDGWKPGVGAGGGAAVTAVSTGTTPQVMTGTWPATYWTQAWDFGGSATVFDIRVDFAGAVANNKASIHWVGLVVKYRPQLSVVTPARVIIGGTRLVGRIPGYSPTNPRGGVYQKDADVAVPEISKLEAQFYANAEGQVDDPGGTFTGTGGSVVIERPPDVIKHFLYTYAYGSPGNFDFMETGTNATGSFSDARASLRNAGPKEFVLAPRFGDRSSVQAMVQQLCFQSGCCAYVDRFTNKWLFFVWKPGAFDTYDRKITYEDTTNFTAEETSVVDARQIIRVQWGFDHFKGKTLFESYITDSNSGQGFTLPTTPDQQLVIVTGVSDKIDWNQGGVKVATLAAGTYQPINLASEARGKMRTALGTNDIEVGYGFTVKTGFNDKIDFKVGATTYAGTMAGASYTAESFAVEFARAMNAVPGHGLVFSCTYDHPTNKLTVSAGSNFNLDGSSAAANFAQSAVHVFGDYAAAAAATSRTAPTARYGERFWFGATANFNMLWSTGANAATSAREVLGFAVADSGSTQDNPGTYLRGNRTDLAATLRGYYGPRPELNFPAEFIRDEESACQLRNRIWDIGSSPRVVVRFSTFRMPDVRRMQTFSFDSSMDSHVAYPKYGSDGSWNNKVMRVLQVEQGLGPNYATEILAISAE